MRHGEQQCGSGRIASLQLQAGMKAGMEASAGAHHGVPQTSN